MPMNPAMSPMITGRFGFLRVVSQLMMATHSGMAATNMDVSPEGRYCSAQTTMPFPPISISPPIIAALVH